VAGAVVGAFVGMSHRPMVQEKMYVLHCGRVKFDAIGAGNMLLDACREVRRGQRVCALNVVAA